MDPFLMSLLGNSNLGSLNLRNFGSPTIPSMIGNRPIGQPYGYKMPPQLAAMAMPGSLPVQAAPQDIPAGTPAPAFASSINPFLAALMGLTPQTSDFNLGIMGRGQ